MDENNVHRLKKDGEKDEETPPAEGCVDPDDINVGLRESKSLLWLAIISIWITLALVLFVGTGSYRTTKEIERLSDSQRFPALIREVEGVKGDVEGIKSDLAAIASRLNTLPEKTGEVVGEAADRITKDLSQGFAHTDKTLGQLLTEQQSATKTVRSDLSANAKALDQAVEKLVAEQRAILAAVSREDADQAERQALLKAFFENQRALLGELSSALAPSEAAAPSSESGR